MSKSIYEVQGLLKGKTRKEKAELLVDLGLWYDWFCETKALNGRTEKFIGFIERLNGDWTKTHDLGLKNNCPMAGNLYDHITIEPLDPELNYSLGYSYGNGDTRPKEVWDSRNNAVRFDKEVGDSIEASALINHLMSL